MKRKRVRAVKIVQFLFRQKGFDTLSAMKKSLVSGWLKIDPLDNAADECIPDAHKHLQET